MHTGPIGFFFFRLQLFSSSSQPTNEVLPWPKKLRQARTSNYRRVHAREITCLCPLARGCPNFFGQGSRMVPTFVAVSSASRCLTSFLWSRCAPTFVLRARTNLTRVHSRGISLRSATCEGSRVRLWASRSMSSNRAPHALFAQWRGSALARSTNLPSSGGYSCRLWFFFTSSSTWKFKEIVQLLLVDLRVNPLTSDRSFSNNKTRK